MKLTNYYFLEPGSNIQATGDFLQENLAVVQADAFGIKGELQNSGKFIFSWKNGNHRKLIHTENNGEYIRHGYMKLSKVDESNWKIPSNWDGKATSGYYSIKNFQGSAGKLLHYVYSYTTLHCPISGGSEK